MSAPVYMVGAGGHAKVVLAALHANEIFPVAVYDNGETHQGSHVHNVPIQGTLHV